MAKFYGPIGYASTSEDSSSSGVWGEIFTEHNYYGDWIRDGRLLQSTDKVNSDISISNRLSILSDPFAINNFHSMRYVTYLNTKWKIENVEVAYPRLILTLGAEFNA